MKAVAVFAFMLMAACSVGSTRSHVASSAREATATDVTRDVSDGGERRVEQIRHAFSTVCRVDGKDFPPSYLIADLGKPGVPKLSKSELEQVRMISKYVHDRTLRFQEVSGQFLIYDAQWGPCMLAAPGYWVLNAKGCNLYFMPADEWSGPSAVNGCWNPPRPWVRGDGGDRNKRWSKFPPAGIFTPAPQPT